MPPELLAYPEAGDERVQDNGSDFLEIDHIAYDRGIFVYVKDHIYPHKGLPSIETVAGINVVKTLMRHGWMFFLIYRKGWKAVAWRATASHMLKYAYMTPTAQWVQDIVERLTGDMQLAQIAAQVIEYDTAYRFRLMDVMTETNEYALWLHPAAEMRRLLAVHKARDYKEMGDKMKGVRMLAWLFYVPLIRNAFRRAIAGSDFRRVQFDEADAYWARIKVDYNYFGV